MAWISNTNSVQIKKSKDTILGSIATSMTAEESEVTWYGNLILVSSCPMF